MTDDDWMEAIIAEPDDVHRLVYADWLEEHDDPERAEFIRVQCELASLPKCVPAGHALFGQLNERIASLHERELELVLNNGWKWFSGVLMFGIRPRLCDPARCDVPAARVRRGFMDLVQCALDKWCGQIEAKGRKIAKMCPLQHVALTDIQPTSVRLSDSSVWVFPQSYRLVSCGLDAIAYPFFQTREITLKAMSDACLGLMKGTEH